jgi:hypothetical protein
VRGTAPASNKLASPMMYLDPGLADKRLIPMRIGKCLELLRREAGFCVADAALPATVKAGAPGSREKWPFGGTGGK